MIWPFHKRKRSLDPPSEVTGVRKEEISDIIDKMPMSFGKWVAGTIVLFAVLFLVFGWFIQYPDTVTGEIQISTTHAPLKLIANSSGKIHLFKNTSQENVREGDYLAVIQNNASVEQIRQVIALLDGFKTEERHVISETFFPEKVTLGDLNSSYYAFLSALKSLRRFNEKNSYEKQYLAIQEMIQSQQVLLSESKEAYSILQEQLLLSEKWYKRFESKLDQITGGVYELEVDNSKSEYLSALQNEKSLKKEIVSTQMLLDENHHKLEQLEIEQDEKQKQLELELLATYHSLKDNLVSWENSYVLKAPFAGQVEFLTFLAENQFIQTGQELFALVPEENKVVGKMHLPATGAGKVSHNSRIKIKLLDYPYNEFGSVEGRVNSISLVTTDMQMSKGLAKNYLVAVHLPDGLKTNFGEKLPFKHDMVGEADIIVNERRLIERLFDNLKQSTR